MDATLASWFVILLAVAAANLPFVNERFLGLFSFFRDSKPMWARLIELTILYFLVGSIAHLLEAKIGNVFSQKWEFYAVTACLFAVLAFPGFVFRYLYKPRS